MKLRSFLTAASAVALMAGTAHANPLGFRMVDADGVDDNAQEEIVNLALESNDMSASASFEFEIFDVAGAEFPTQNDLDIVITLPEGVSFAAPGGNSTDPVSGTMGSVTGGSLTSGGAPGTDTARYTVSLDNRIGRDNFTIGFKIPLALDLSVCGTEDKDDLGSYALKVDVTTLNDGGAPLSGTPIFGQTVSGADAIILQCVDGIVHDVNSDEDSSNSRVALSNYNTFLPGFLLDDDDTQQFPLQGNFSFDQQGQQTSTVLGSISHDLDTTAVIKLGPSTDTNNFLDVTDIDSMGYTIQYGDVTGMPVTTVFAPGTALGFAGNNPVTNAAAISYPPGFIAALYGPFASDLQIIANSSVTAEIEEQEVSVTDSFVTFTAASMGVSEFDDDLCGNGPLDTLQRQGRRFGFFDWIGEDRPVRNVFRISGLPHDATGASPEDVELDLIFNNSRGGPAYEGRFDMVIPAGDISNGVVSITSDDFDVINPGHDQSDVLILVQNTSRDIDVDRLQVDRTGAINDFGGGANIGFNFFGEVTPSGDGDDELGSE